MSAAIGISKTTSLMIAGGWAHEDIREDLQAMFYNFQQYAGDIDHNILTEIIAEDLNDFGFSNEMISLDQTMPNMDTIAKIFLNS